MSTFTYCLFKNSDQTGNTTILSFPFNGSPGFFINWPFSNKRSTHTKIRYDNEQVIHLPNKLDTSNNRTIIDDNLPSGTKRISDIRAGMIQWPIVEYYADNPSRHSKHTYLVDLSFRVKIDLPWYCSARGNDTRATIHYYLYFFLNSNKNLRARVDGAWWNRTEGAGINRCEDEVKDRLNRNVRGNIDLVQRLLNDSIRPFASIRFRSLYILPGTGITDGREDIDNSREDASLILVL